MTSDREAIEQLQKLASDMEPTTMCRIIRTIIGCYHADNMVELSSYIRDFALSEIVRLNFVIEEMRKNGLEEE